jgi:uncharacterized membrane protein
LLDLATIFAVNLLLAVLSIPFVWDLVARNRFYGFRVPATLRDDHIWYVMNRRVAREMIIVGFVLAFCAAGFDRAGLNTSVERAFLTIVTIAALATVTIRGWVAANRLDRQRPSSL